MAPAMQYLNQVNFIILLWVVFFVTHSVFASKEFKDIFIKLAGKYYRILYNLIAVVFFSFSYLKTMALTQQPFVYYPRWAIIIFTVIKLMALCAFIYSFKFYNMKEFLGIEQVLTNNKSASHSKLCLSPLHQVVRHPWYFIALIIIWPGTDNNINLMLNLLFTSYFFIGSYFEEQKLEEEFGEDYKQYKKEVSGIIPIKYFIKLFSLH